jgi:hypothetical protein
MLASLSGWPVSRWDPSVFEWLAPGVGIGTGAPANWRPLAAGPLVVLVGVTGTGKSTLLSRLTSAGLPLCALPDRRVLTDRCIIAPLQQADGETPHTLRRMDRYPYVERFQAAHPGGLAVVLASLQVDPAYGPAGWIFDGLRGVAEITHAVATLPHARFLACTAPDPLRIRRIAGRNDPHDISAARADTAEVWQELLALPGVDAVLSLDDRAALRAWAGRAGVPPAVLYEATRIVVRERRVFNPNKTVVALRALAPERALVLDTALLSAEHCARVALTWLARVRTEDKEAFL